MSQDRSFQRYIRHWVREYGTAQRLAETIDMSLSAFSRGYRNEQTFSTETCLRFAKETGEPYDKVLQLAGKGDVAALIKELSGPAAKREPLSGPLREDVDALQKLNGENRATIRGLIRKLIASQR